MLVSERFEGSRIPFEGDRQLVLRSLPEGARVTSATISLDPVAPPGGTLFEESIAFKEDQGEWGAHKREDHTSFAEVDFHTRRTLSDVSGIGLHNASLQVDIGGLYVQINALGAMSTPDDGEDDFALDGTSGLLPSLTTQKFKLSLADNPRITHVGIRSAPSNLSLRLGGQPPFWARPGELARSEDVPDFSVILNAFLQENEAQDGYYEIPLTIHSDSLCRMDVSVQLEYMQNVAALPDGLSEAALTFDYSTLTAGTRSLVSVRLPPGARVLPGETTARVRGSFADSRIVCGPTGKLEPVGVARVTAERSLATPLVFTEQIEFSAVDLLLTSVSRTAELALDLVEDADGKPYTRSVLPSQVKLAIDSQVQSKPTWVHIPLPAEVQLKAQTRLWLVVQSLRGEAGWSIANQAQVAAASTAGTWTAGEAIAADQATGTALGMLYTNTGGLAWRSEDLAGVTGPLAGFLHLRQPPPSYRVPIELEVGAGEGSRRVSLQRFEPLGQVDFDLGFAEVAEAINEAAAAARAAIPEGEHLLNGDLELWRRVGDKPAADLDRYSMNTVLEGLGGYEVLAPVAASPDGRCIYLTLHKDDSNDPDVLLEIDANCQVRLRTFELPEAAGSPQGLTISPDGRRLCISTANHLVWVDLDRWELVGTAQVDNTGYSANPGRTVFSPDGGRLYVKRFERYMSPGRIHVLDVAALERAMDPGQVIDLDENQIITSISLDDNTEPVDLAVSPEGSLLYLLIADHNSSEVSPSLASPAYLTAYDAIMPGTEPLLRVEVGANPDRYYPVGLARGGLALSTDGSRAIAVNGGSGTAAVVALPRGILLGQIRDLSDPNGSAARPVAVVVHQDGNYALIADYKEGESGQLIAYDIRRLRVLRRYPTSAPPVSLSALAGGDRILATCRTFGASPLVALRTGARTPDEWSVTSGTVQRLCAPAPFRLAAVLGDFSRGDRRDQTASIRRKPTALSQVVPVTGGVPYELSFWGLATTPEAVAELFWYGDDCAVRRVDRLPFATYDGDRDELLSGLKKMLDSGGVLSDAAAAELHRMETDSPPGAELVELRFSTPENEAAAVDRISLKATADAVTNSDLRQLDAGRLVGWTLVPASVPGSMLVAEANGLRFNNGSGQQVALEQATGFSSQVPFELTFVGRGEESAAGAEPRVELTFLDETGEALAASLKTVVAAQGSDRVMRSGESPAGTAAVLIRLVAPPGTGLFIQRISLLEVAMVEVPLDFVAQAPGDLNISGLQVAYEMRSPSAPTKLPPAGLCPPTPPDGTPGTGRRNRCYCPCCGETDDLCDTLETETAGGQPAVEGECCHCGARQLRIGGGGYGATASFASGSPETRASVVADTGAATPSVERSPTPEAVTARWRNRGAPPVVVRAPSAAPVTASRSFMSRNLALHSRGQPATVEGDLSSVAPPVPKPSKVAAPSGEISGEEGPSRVPAEEGTLPATPPITEVTGVTAEIAAQLAAAELDTLERLATARPSEIAAALTGAKPDAARRISRNARRLLRNV